MWLIEARERGRRVVACVAGPQSLQRQIDVAIESEATRQTDAIAHGGARQSMVGERVRCRGRARQQADLVVGGRRRDAAVVVSIVVMVVMVVVMRSR